MADTSKDKGEGRQVGEGSRMGTIPTGADMTSEGSSVVTNSDLATAEEIPSTEEILRKGRENRRTAPAPSGVPESRYEPSPPGDEGWEEDIE